MIAYIVHILILICIYIILAISLQLAIGYTGLLNLAHVSFFGIGAYTSALLTINGAPFIVSFLMSGVLAMIFGFFLTLVVNKLKGDYLALVTLGFSFVIYAVMLNWTGLTRGPMGIPAIPKPNIAGIEIADNWLYLLWAVLVLLISLWIIKRVVRSPFGRVLESIRDDELAVKMLGKNVLKMKLLALGISAFFAGIAGSLFAHYITFIDPGSFSLVQLGTLLSIVMIGGLASLRGTVIASIIIIVLPEPMRFIGFPLSIVGPARQAMYALIILLVLILRPRGFWGKVTLE